MTISQMPFLPSIASGDPIPHFQLSYLQEQTRNILFEYVLSKFLEAEHGGFTKAQLARRIQHSPEVVTRWLGAPGNWRISTISDLLAGICGEELIPNSKIIDDGQCRNFRAPPWLKEPKAKPILEAYANTTSTNASISIGFNPRMIAQAG